MSSEPPDRPPEGWQAPQKPGWGPPEQQPPWQGPQPGWGQQPPWGYPSPPRPQLTAGRAFLIMLGAAVGAVLGFFAPFLPGFLLAVLFGTDFYGENPAPWVALAMLVTIPCGAILGGLWARQRTRRGEPMIAQPPAGPPERWRPPQVPARTPMSGQNRLLLVTGAVLGFIILIAIIGSYLPD
jgi:hypothetical protein